MSPPTVCDRITATKESKEGAMKPAIPREEFRRILKDELIIALGCTEPGMVAYAAALVTSKLGVFPERLDILASGNIIKNVKTVVVPHGGGLKGVKACGVLGALTGRSDLKLEILGSVETSHIQEATKLLAGDFCTLTHLDSEDALHLVVKASYQESWVEVEIKGDHLRVIRLDKNDGSCLENSPGLIESLLGKEYTELSVEGICNYIEQPIDPEVAELIQGQIDHNRKIAEEGLLHQYGLNVGSTILKYQEKESLRDFVKSFAAAGSDARMAGCDFPVVINCGSGNVGMTISNSIYAFCTKMEIPRERMVQAVLFADLLTIHVKSKIGRLSCFCGPVAAACGVSAAFIYLRDGGVEYDRIAMSIKHVLAAITGIICDGAKESCASKIATCVDAALQSYYLVIESKSVSHGCGIVSDDVEETILHVGDIAKKGMLQTDKVILDVMTKI